MDPNAVLDELRAAIADYDATADVQEADAAAQRIANAAEALDGWLSMGGFLPVDWAKGR